MTMNFDSQNSSFTRLGSFRQASITERLQDPQLMKPSPPKEPVGEAAKKVDNPFAIARPHATDLMYQRQASFRGLGGQLQSNSPFKRQMSLRISELPSTLERRVATNNNINTINKEGTVTYVEMEIYPSSRCCLSNPAVFVLVHEICSNDQEKLVKW